MSESQPDGFKTMDEMAKEHEPGEYKSDADGSAGGPEEENVTAQDSGSIDPTEFNEQKVPPTDDDVESNRMLWLVAKTCHEVNRAFCREVLMDHSHLPWEQTPQSLKDSIFSGVLAHFEDPELTPEESHRKWMEYKSAEGWTFGNNKDADAKTHPCMLPYDQLHKHDRAKDHLFASVCKSFFGSEL
jgi:hypothetical protein